MKTTNVIYSLVILMATACGGNKSDSKDVAEEINEERFEDTDIQKDADFAVEAADGSMMEVQLGKLALKNGSSEAVKNFAQTMIDDHTQAGEELKSLASQKQISLPMSMSDKCQSKYNDLADKTGDDFDEAYADLMVKDHKDDIDEFKKEVNKGNDADLKVWAGGKLPTLEKHLSMAESMKDAVN